MVHTYIIAHLPYLFRSGPNSLDHKNNQYRPPA